MCTEAESKRRLKKKDHKNHENHHFSSYRPLPDFGSRRAVVRCPGTGRSRTCSDLHSAHGACRQTAREEAPQSRDTGHDARSSGRHAREVTQPKLICPRGRACKKDALVFLLVSAQVLKTRAENGFNDTDNHPDSEFHEGAAAA
jgi:hypothetical protein